MVAIEVRELEEIERVAERFERPRELIEERFGDPRGALVGDNAFERENIRADDLLNRAEVDRLRFDGDHWHPHHDFHQNGPVIINQESAII
ncbi:hypothetical protein [Streptomyces sp. NBC_01565]|uniref:hypothetical protein n=1 Tax=unclassified Streptomyces TaxID=2593676 RepID=UPI0022577604|nr:hypothetical protein [Streptomyces sp. NBC_01565]MCX4539073.1 hypothetical protein [Streptomyces sp. NBC_01565]